VSRAVANGLADLSDRTKLRLTGADRVRYLNGQVTNNVASLRPGETCYALVCNHKGKVEADVFITAHADELRLDAPPELRDSLFTRLSKYVISDDCEITDVTDDCWLTHELGAGVVHRFGVPGSDQWLPRRSTKPRATVSADELERLRLEHAIPKWGAELTPHVLPQEAGLAERAVDFRKGCYIGQEVISRLKSVGHVNRHLRAFETVSADQALRAGHLLFKPGDLSEVGVITSARWYPAREKSIALGYVKRTLELDGAVLPAGVSQADLSSTVTLRNISPPELI